MRLSREILFWVTKTGESMSESDKISQSAYEIQTVFVNVEDVIKYYVRGFEGGPPATYDWYLDPVKRTGAVMGSGVFILRIYRRKAKPGEPE